jgi:HAD superfamily hydrolase (TIGR01549 family)
MQRLALFDLDDTLVDRRAAFLVWAKEFIVKHNLGDQSLRWLLAADERHAGPKERLFTTVRERYDLNIPAQQLWAQYRLRMPELVSCRPADLGALRQLREADWRIGIVTNGTTDSQLRKITGTGLQALLDGWCISDEVGIRKPDAAIFRLAAHRCGTALEYGGWMVGDDLACDIAGGRTAGLRTIWLRLTSDAPPKAGPVPDFHAGSITEAVHTMLRSA